MEEKEFQEEIVVEFETLTAYVAKETGVSEDVVEAVLEAEMKYLEKCGLVLSIDEE